MRPLHQALRQKHSRIHLPKVSSCTFSIFAWGQKQGCHMTVSEGGTNIWLRAVVADLEEVYKPSVASQRPVVLEGLPQDGARGDAQGQTRPKRRRRETTERAIKTRNSRTAVPSTCFAARCLETCMSFVTSQGRFPCVYRSRVYL